MNLLPLCITMQLFLINCSVESFQIQYPVSKSKYFPQKVKDPYLLDIIGMESKRKSKDIDVKAENAKLNSSYVYQPDWPDLSINLGDVTAVSFDKAGNVVIFHRGDRRWSDNTFKLQIFQERSLGPIEQSPVLGLDNNSGKLVYDWGKNIFYMPHGLTIDAEDNVWVTDVALHQVMKFGPRGSSGKPLLTIGTAFTPGKSDSKFCMPTSVAVLPNGDFFVADGYCNSRIMKYSASGEKIIEWGQLFHEVDDTYTEPPPNFFAVPHAMTLVPDQDLVCTADRGNGRIQCFSSNNGTFQAKFQSQIIGNRMFSMDYTPVEGGQFVIVNGKLKDAEVHGYVMDIHTKQVTGKFGPNDMQFSKPHDIAVTADGTEIYVAELKPSRVHKFLKK